MNKIIEIFPEKAGYEMSNTFFHDVCYVNEVVLIADFENDLQRLLHSFNTKTKINIKYAHQYRNAQKHSYN